MKEILATIDEAGRLVLPKNVRKRLAVKPGDIFKITVAGSTVTLMPARAAAGLVKKGKALVFSTGDKQTLGSGLVNGLMETTRVGHRVQTLNAIRRASRGR
jgi:AbrB family looped-hinge helix DNA binding protein